MGDTFQIGTGERVRIALAVLRSRFTTGADGGLAWLVRRLEDLGFSNVVAYVDRARLPANWPMRDDRAVLEFPEWEAWFEGTWRSEGALIKEDWTEMRALHRHAAPAAGAPAVPPPVAPPAPNVPTETHPMTPWEGPIQAHSIPAKQSVIPLLLQPVLIAGGLAAGVTFLSWAAKRAAKTR
jgi:hypothetical protein